VREFPTHASTLESVDHCFAATGNLNIPKFPYAATLWQLVSLAGEFIGFHISAFTGVSILRKIRLQFTERRSFISLPLLHR
jgi:hypothetical protein